MKHRQAKRLININCSAVPVAVRVHTDPSDIAYLPFVCFGNENLHFARRHDPLIPFSHGMRASANLTWSVITEFIIQMRLNGNRDTQ